MKVNTRAITLTATLAALCAVSGLLPYVFFLPVMVAATTLTVGTVAAVGLSFGIISIVYSFIRPSLVALAFIQAPYIAVLPRIAAALGAFGVYVLINKLCKPRKKATKAVAVGAAAAVGSVLNTAIVVALFVLVCPTLEFGGVTMMAYVPAMLISGAIEFACMAVLTPPISLTLDKVVLKKHNKPLAVGEAVESYVPTDGAKDGDKSADADDGTNDNTTEQETL